MAAGVPTQKGATKYGEAKGGHLPGAIYFPYLDLFNSDGTLKANADGIFFVVILCYYK